MGITTCDWKMGLIALKINPDDTSIWIEKYDDNVNGTKQYMSRYLPIHSACALDPPVSFINSILLAYPEGVKALDDQGMTPLHYACSNMASKEVIQILLKFYPDSINLVEPSTGRYPLHLAVYWGQSSLDVLKLLLEHDRKILSTKDIEGNIPLELAINSEYKSKEVIALLQRETLNEFEGLCASLCKYEEHSPIQIQKINQIINFRTSCT